jgi:hypothetical protein
MEEINIEWCKQHDMICAYANVVRDTSYYLEQDGNLIFVYTQSTTGEQKIYVRNPHSFKGCELTIPKINILTTDDLKKLCELVGIEYPFK